MLRMKINPHIKNVRLSIRRITELASKTLDCVRFDIGQPDFDTPTHIKDAAKKALDKGKTGYVPVLGIPELRKAIAKYESKKGINVEKENVMVTNGGMGSIFSIFLGMLEKHEEIILPNPYWAPYDLILGCLNLKFKTVPYIKNSELDEEKLLNSINEKTRMVLVNSPVNPTGEVLNTKTLKKIAKIAEDKELIVISDEVYERLLFGDAEFVSIAGHIPDKTIRINSTSKTYAMTGWRIGWMTAPVEVIEELKKCNRATTACVNAFAQYGALEALTGDQSCVEDMRSEYEKRFEIMKKRVSELGWTFPEVRGAFYTFPDTGKDSWEYSLNLIKKAKVSTIPGEAFGSAGKTSLRLCFGSANIEQINKGFDRIEAYEKQ